MTRTLNGSSSSKQWRPFFKILGLLFKERISLPPLRAVPTAWKNALSHLGDSI